MKRGLGDEDKLEKAFTDMDDICSFDRKYDRCRNLFGIGRIK